jgi:putative transcriptional regulator
MRVLKPAEIKSVREGLGMSQAEFAQAFRLNVRNLQKWEIGGARPSGGTSVLLWLISRIPQQILKALKDG